MEQAARAAGVKGIGPAAGLPFGEGTRPDGAASGGDRTSSKSGETLAASGAPDAAERAAMRAERARDAAAAGFSRTIALTLGYEGSGFSGFARQAESHVVTVQGELERALSLLYKRDVGIVCAGRTDAGVHAREQVVTYDVTQDELELRSPRTLLRSLNALVDDAISISRVDEAPLGFSARFDAAWREYHYHICTQPARPVLIAPVVWHLGGVELDMDAMNEAATRLIGEHDFKSFCMAASAVGKPTRRTLMELSVAPEVILGTPCLTVRVVGSAFLHSMVRTIVGTLVEVGRGRRDPAWVADVLAARDRRAAGQNAPARGLVFWRVGYGEDGGEGLIASPDVHASR